MTSYDSYVICTSPRSGSTLLCRLLAATGAAGNPESYFHRSSITDWLTDLELTADPAAPAEETLEAIFRAAVAEGTLDTGVFGLRLQRHSFDFFMAKLTVLHPGAVDDIERFEAAFGRTLFIYLTRGDKVGQAVSYVKAWQTGLWHQAPDGTEIERLAPPAEPAYDAAALRAALDEMEDHDRDWLDWFSAAGIAPLRITYEALSADPLAVVREILAALGRDPGAADGVAVGVAKLADAVSRDWVERFRGEEASA